jgi:[acyl-carrier-protein] S-malonyltransferase
LARLAAVFPGQGAQSVGMGRALALASPAARAVFDEVDAALGEPLSRLCFEGPIETLTLTANAQPALMATSLAAWRALEERLGRPLAGAFELAAGHSLGEWSALTALGALDFADTARLLRLRGRAMQDAVPPGEGAMAAILGMEPEAVEDVARDAAAGETLELANDNEAGQAVISGHRAAVERGMALAKDRGAKRCLLLPVSAPFHCALMAPAAAAVAEALRDVSIRAPAVPVIANVTVEPVRDPVAIRSLLARQVTARVRWRETMAAMAARGIDTLIEFGAGKVLTGMARRGLPGARLLNLAAPEDLDAVAAALDGGGAV